MSRAVKGIEETFDVLNSFHLAWTELNKTKKKTVKNSYGLFAIAGNVLLDTTADAKPVFFSPATLKIRKNKDK